MATVTGMTAAAMLAIRNQTVVSGEFDASGRLILTRYDGTQIDAGTVANSTTGQAGIVELATAEETSALTDASRAVTPASLVPTINGLDTRIDTLEATRVQILSGVAESATPESYPPGFSLMSLGTASGWSLNGGLGSVVTNKVVTDRTEQTFYSDAGGTGTPQTWWRFYNAGWTNWVRISTLATLDGSSFFQGTAVSAYPMGESMIRYESGSALSWDFSGQAGELRTWRDASYTKQIWTADGGYQVWRRTADSSGIWTVWRKTAFMDNLPAIESGRVDIPAVANTVTTLTVGFTVGRFEATPQVVVTPISGGPYTLVRECTVSNVTTTQFDINIYRTNDGNTGVYYIAALAL